MKIAYVVSDLSFPPREGIHQQTVELIRQLGARENEVVLLGYRRPGSSIDWDLLRSYLGHAVEVLPFEPYRGSSLLAAVRRLAVRRIGHFGDSTTVHQLTRMSFDVAVLEGPLACTKQPGIGRSAASPQLDRPGLTPIRSDVRRVLNSPREGEERHSESTL